MNMVCCKPHHLPWKPLSPPLFPNLNDTINPKNKHPMVLTMSSSSIAGSLSDENEAGVLKGKGSGTTARGRRLLKLREEKRKREYDRLHNYPAWAKYSLYTLLWICFLNEDSFFNFDFWNSEFWKMLVRMMPSCELFLGIALVILSLWGKGYYFSYFLFSIIMFVTKP